ncbi:MAG: glycosyltransferase family 9 protein [Nitrospinae bacterium]|nr:glycosyltransferase family 9 protein [Nitrospinota bacterium]
MRTLDLLVGGILVQIINVLSLFKMGRRSGLPERRAVANILFIKFFGGGSLILSTPMARGLKKRYPNARISLLTFRENRELAGRLPVYDRIITLRNDAFGGFFADLVRNLFRIWRTRPDLVVDGEFFSNFTNVLSWMTFAKFQVGFYQRQVARGKTYSHKVSLNNHKHIAHIFFSLAAAVGARYEDAELTELDLKPPDAGEIASAFAKLGLPSGAPVVVVNPNASPLSYLRRWPAGHFVALVSEMVAIHPDFYYVFVGSGNEADYVESIAARIPSPAIKNSAGKLTMGELLALVYKSGLVITNDSLPVHIASGYKKNVAAFFGPETPRLYGPLNGNALTFFEDIHCSPCLLTFANKLGEKCGDNVCLGKITPRRVLEEIERRFFSQGTLAGDRGASGAQP